jgi:flagellar biosynthetic protein FliQ
MDPVLIASDISRSALEITFILSVPLLLVGLVVGVVISVLQAATQVQEQTLAFIPKIVAMMAALYFLMPVLIQLLVNYSKETFMAIKTVPF